jgi:hypothetical protein
MNLINTNNVNTRNNNKDDNINNTEMVTINDGDRSNINILYLLSNNDYITRDITKNSTNNESYSDNENNQDNININIYRYKFTNEFMEELFKFSKIHQYDHRNDFKEAWKQWVDDNLDIINKETRRLIELGYDGDIIDKMYKSARYYFRKKSTEKKEPIKRRLYISVQKEFLDAIDEHINNNIHLENFKPSEGFNDFCKNQPELLKQEVFTLYRAGMTDSDEIKNKIKKTYKNRYFLFISK